VTAEPSNSSRLQGLRELQQFLTPQEAAELDHLLSRETWVPLPGPQTAAYNSLADDLYYGGSAGGGKTDLLIGLALTKHRRSIIFRREATQLESIYDRCAEILGHRNGFNGHDKVWRLPDRKMEFGSCKDPGSESSYQGRPHDLKCFDEVPLFMEQQFRFLNGWKRSTIRNQRVRTVAAGNPPTDSDGEWVMRYWAPWLDEHHTNPAGDGELRWFAVLDGKDTEVDGPDPFQWKQEIVIPHSRSFIRSMVQDNPFLMESGYEQTLQALPEPLRSQMLRGDFKAGRDDDPWQVIPTEWVRLAMDRWQPRERKGVMTAMGVDVARGGRDYTVLSTRHGNWYDELQAYPGNTTPDGPTTAGLVVSKVRDGCSIHVDVIGVGAAVFDFLEVNRVNVTGVNVAEGSEEYDKSGRLGFINKRAEIAWKFREALDPSGDEAIALPPDEDLRADLCAPRWKVTQRGIQVESREDIIKRIGRSPDRASAVLLASMPPFEKWIPVVRTGRRFV
jgi:hypothetical protein